VRRCRLWIIEYSLIRHLRTAPAYTYPRSS
jgi:hypothetical protein